MPDPNKNSGSKFENFKRSVLESDHPVFGKIKKELPNLNRNFVQSESRISYWLTEISKTVPITQIGLVLACSIVISFFIYRQITDPFLDYKLGDIAQRHLVAQRTMEIVDQETTEAKKLASADSVLSVYDYDRKIYFKTTEKIHRAFAILRRHHVGVLKLTEKKGIPQAELYKSELFLEAKAAFADALGIELSDGQFEAIVRTNFSQRIERAMIHLLARVNLNLTVSNRDLLKQEKNKGITLNRIREDQQNKSEQVLSNLDFIIDVDSARNDIAIEAKNYLIGPYAAYADRIVPVIKRLVVPNLTLNRQETERRREAVVEEIKPVLIKINKGDSIVRYQDVINKRHLIILRQLEKASKNDKSKFQFTFTTIFLSMIFFALILFFEGGMGTMQIYRADFFALALLMVGTILTIKGIQFVSAEALVEKFPQIPLDFYYYLVPVASGAVIVRMLMDKASALIFAFMLAVVGGILLERNYFYTVFIFTSSLFSSAVATKIKTRGVIFRTGLIAGIVNFVLLICIMANTRNAASLSMLYQDLNWVFWCGLLSGIFMSVFVVSMVPLIEFVTGRTSDLRLLELANMNHPLLRDLMVKAPGTYHHSIVIGSLVEAAAESIGANPLLARVMAYYHDVGKMERPLYFIENQGGGYNRHDALQPHMSAMIIRDHVKKGQELGRKFKLPQAIIDAMSEHHGSSTIWYFYNKARGAVEDPDSVLESDYKYEGRKPQTKETALVMLGDVVEAATRSVADPTPLRLSGVVKNILNKYFAEGQLSECDLTLRDLDLIAKSFLDVLLGIYHARIEYGVSSIRESAKRKHGNSDSKASQRPRVNSATGANVVGAQSSSPPVMPFPSSGSGSGDPKKR